jgi:hypothetical protein
VGGVDVSDHFVCLLLVGLVGFTAALGLFFDLISLSFFSLLYFLSLLPLLSMYGKLEGRFCVASKELTRYIFQVCYFRLGL